MLKHWSSLSVERMELVDFSYVFEASQIVLNVPSPDLILDNPMEWWMPLRSLSVFSTSLWITVVITSV